MQAVDSLQQHETEMAYAEKNVVCAEMKPQSCLQEKNINCPSVVARKRKHWFSPLCNTAFW